MSDPSPPFEGVELRDNALARISGRVPIPMYDRRAIRPAIVHIGVGGFHRSHLATYVDDLCSAGDRAWGIVGSGVLPTDEQMALVLRRQDGLYSLITRTPSKSMVNVVGSLLHYIHAWPDAGRLVSRIADSDTQLVTLTLTEAGYPVDHETGEFDSIAAPSGPGSAFDVIVAGLERRYEERRTPISLVSCDNIARNGDAARAATLGVAERRSAKLWDWIAGNVAFPNSMVDRITPSTTDEDRVWLAETYGILDGWPVVTEPFRQWVIEDSFAGEAPPLHNVGVTFTSDVQPYELMKIRLLNGGHSCIAYLSALAGFERVDSALAEPGVNKFLRSFLDIEAAPVLPKIAGLEVSTYIASLLERLSNPAIGDRVSRLCRDGSAKIPKFLLPTVRDQLAIGGPIELSALALAGWCAYLIGVADDGRRISHASDPALQALRASAVLAVEDPTSFLRLRTVFGEDLSRSQRLADAFAKSLSSLRSVGARSSLNIAFGGKS
jgi:mannitol 2-dehydrogenase